VPRRGKEGSQWRQRFSPRRRGVRLPIGGRDHRGLLNDPRRTDGSLSDPDLEWELLPMRSNRITENVDAASPFYSVWEASFWARRCGLLTHGLG
jgi:hypothetical protein